MPRPERPLDPSTGPLAAFAAELRQLRNQAGNPTYLDMARALRPTGPSKTALTEAAGGDHLPKWSTVEGFVSVCGGDVTTWLHRWERVSHELDELRYLASQTSPKADGLTGLDVKDQSVDTPPALEDNVVGALADGRTGSSQSTAVLPTDDEPPSPADPLRVDAHQDEGGQAVEDSQRPIQLGPDQAPSLLTGSELQDERRERSGDASRADDVSEPVIHVQNHTPELKSSVQRAPGSRVRGRVLLTSVAAAAVVALIGITTWGSQVRDGTSSPSGQPSGTTPSGAVITVQNKVAVRNQLVEDGTAAFLSSQPVPYCAKRGCVVPGTQVLWSGATLLALCQLRGEELTNANESNVTEDNSGVVRSDRWYRVRLNQTVGMFPEVFVVPADRGGLGLPTCET